MPWELLLHILLMSAAACGWRYQRDRCEGRHLNYDIFVSNGLCYQFVDKEVTWTDARAYCRRYGGQLLKIENAATQTFIKQSLNGLRHWSNQGVWFGANDRSREGHWTWDDGKPITYTNWRSREPAKGLFKHKDCGQLRRLRGWAWVARGCTYIDNMSKYKFICQYLPVLPPTTSSLRPSVAEQVQASESPSPADGKSTVTSPASLPRNDTTLTSPRTSQFRMTSAQLVATNSALHGVAVADSPHKETGIKSVIVYVAVAVLSLVIVILLICLVVVRRRRRHKYADPPLKVMYTLTNNVDVDTTHQAEPADNQLYMSVSGASTGDPGYEEPVCPPPLPARDGTGLTLRAVPNTYSAAPSPAVNAEQPVYESLDSLKANAPQEVYQPLGPVYDTPRSSHESVTQGLEVEGELDSPDGNFRYDVPRAVSEQPLLFGTD